MSLVSDLAVRVAPKLLARPLAGRVLARWVGEFNPFPRAMREDPYPALASLRSRAPVYASPLLRCWLLTRYADVAQVLRDPRFSADRRNARIVKPPESPSPELAELLELIPRTLLFSDPPAHTRLRKLVGKAFTPGVVERLRPSIEALVADRLDAGARAGRVDWVRDVADPIPATVIARLLGVPPEDEATLRGWSRELLVLLDPISNRLDPKHFQQTLLALRDYFARLFEARRREPQDDLMSKLVRVRDEGDLLSESELFALCIVILIAGYETTTNLLGNAVLLLARHPDQRSRLQADPALMSSAIEEFLRFDSPVQATARACVEDAEIGGQWIRKGDLVMPHFGAANRDPERFHDPDRLDIGRTDNAHLAFGIGGHLCLGRSLARLEAEVMLAALLRRFPTFKLATERPLRRPTILLRGIESLPLAL